MTAEFEITPEMIREHGLTESEYQGFLDIVGGRKPTLAELGIVSAMWNEHCSYKSTKKHLRTLPTTGEKVIQGPGENAGIVDIGDGLVAVFKMESHNHPSYIEPYHGAATGMGGILRDVFTMGARPVAAMNALWFGSPDHPKTRHIVSGVVAGIGGYGNSFGVPTVGGQTGFHSDYDGNPLVNAFAVGITGIDGIFYSEAKGIGLPVVYLGAKTGRDGVGGASMASAEFDENTDEKRPTVQVGDPFTEKCLLEACMELMQTDAVIAIQDMGAAGLTCSSVEMGAKGNLGIELDLDKLPVRESGMTAYEMLLSESQERMLMILEPDRQDEAERIFNKWGLDFAIIGRTIEDARFIVKHQGDVHADLPIRELADQAPEYDRPYEIRKDSESLPVIDFSGTDIIGSLLRLLGSPDGCSKRWISQQYDSMIQGNTVASESDAAIVRVSENSYKGLAMSVDVTPRYCKADAYEGGKQAVAECWRNLCAAGAEPLAVTDCLNFGNPEKPEIMGSIVESMRGIGDACRHLDFPVVSGNVSLYNETAGRSISPTPSIGGIGLLPDVRRHAGTGFKPDETVMLIGTPGKHLGQSMFLRECLEMEIGLPPAVDLETEKRHGEFVRGLIADRLIKTCHDISDGGMLVALAEMSMTGNIGCELNIGVDDFNCLIPYLYGEDQARYLVASSNASEIISMAEAEGIPIEIIGQTGGTELVVNGSAPVSISSLQEAHELRMPDFMQ